MENRLVTAARIALLLCAVGSGCKNIGTWQTVNSENAYTAGPSIIEPGDMSKQANEAWTWAQFVILENEGAESYYPGFRDAHGLVKARTDVRVAPHEKFAMQVGKDANEFVLVASRGQAPPSSPKRLARIPRYELIRFPTARVCQ